MSQAGLLTVEAHNFKIHKNLKIDLNKESALVIGDSGTGKSSFLEIVQAHIDQEPYPSNPLSEGENEGFTRTTRQAKDGLIYTTVRKYKRMEDGSVKLDRFEVRGPDGRKKSLEEIMETHFDGAFTHSRFNYNKYFNKSKSPEDRYKIFVEAIGDDIIDKNFNDIDELEEKRGTVGSDRKVKDAIWRQGISDPDNIPADFEKYSVDRDVSEAVQAADLRLNAKMSAEAYLTEVSNHNSALVIIPFEEIAIAELEVELESIKKAIADRKATMNEAQKSIRNERYLTSINKKIVKIAAHNERIAKEAADIYNKTIDEVVEFKTQKAAFFSSIEAFQEWQLLEAEWNELDQQIKDKRAENDARFKKLLPLPELSIGEVITKKDGEEKIKRTVLYKGREFGPSNLSTGEAIQITAAIQLALNPAGDNFIVIPQAQSLGSKLRDIMDACKKFNVQFLVEMTLPDEEFRIEVIEDTL